jgi:glutamine---fructose-6-phosphate transaminase (isomerizing)
MCGITIFVSKNNKNIIKNILESLIQIQNRGYDSVGIALKLDSWNIYKYASTETEDGIDKLSKQIKNISSTMAIGHTRWATHGAKNDINSHPHSSMRGNIIVVHNGIITNFQEIKNFLIDNHYCFYSETDTEVIANLIEYYLLEGNSISRAIELAQKKMCGTWALGIICSDEPDSVYITRHGSPLLLGYNDNLIICSSEISGFTNLIYNYIILENNDIIVIDNKGYTSKHLYKSNSLETTLESNSPSPFIHWTLKEIYDQPTSIVAAFNNGARILDNNIRLGGLSIMKNILESSKIEHLILLGCGTSSHACMLSKYYFKNEFSYFNTVQAFDASEFSKIDIPQQGKVLCIICSQSGETRDLINSIEICRKESCLLLGVVNVVDSLIAQSVDCGVYLNAGREVAVASTKSFTSTLIVLSLISMWFKEKHSNIPIINSLRSLSNVVDDLLVNHIFKNKCKEIVEFINENKIQSIFILGRQKMFPIAREIALKIKELTYIHAEGYSGGSLKHGPFALLDQKTLTFLLIDNDMDNLSTYYEITSRNTHCFIVSDCENLLNTKGLINTDNILMLPKVKYYQEIIFTIALQYLSYELSISRNINPDKPRNLAKVVTVE